MKDISRRELLKVAGLAVGTAAIMPGLGLVGAIEPASAAIASHKPKRRRVVHARSNRTPRTRRPGVRQRDLDYLDFVDDSIVFEPTIGDYAVVDSIAHLPFGTSRYLRHNDPHDADGPVVMHLSRHLKYLVHSGDPDLPDLPQSEEFSNALNGFGFGDLLDPKRTPSYHLFG